MNRRFCCGLAGILIAAFCIGASEEAGPPTGSGVLWEARTMAAQARQQLQAAAHAARAGDAEKFGSHEAKAKEMFAEARQLIEQAGGMRLDDAEALVDYAGVLQAQNDADLAAKALRRATRIEPEDPDVWLALGRGLLTPLYRRPDEAARALERAAEAGAGGRVEGAARAVLGRLYWDKGLFDFAGEEWSRALEVAPEEVSAQAGMAAILARRGNMADASQLVQKIAEASPDALVVVGPLLGEALEDFEQSGLWIDDTAEAHFAYASLLLRAGRYAESVAPLERTVALDPENHIAWNMIGSIHGQLGRADRAREAFERSLHINPDQERTREALKALEAAGSEDAGGETNTAPDGGEAAEPATQGSGTGAPPDTSK